VIRAARASHDACASAAAATRFAAIAGVARGAHRVRWGGFAIHFFAPGAHEEYFEIAVDMEATRPWPVAS
jgi:hypothetical protein